METMIPPQVGMRLRTKKINKRGQRSPNKKNERKREKGQCYYPFTTLVLQSSTMIFILSRGQAVLGRQGSLTTPWLTDRNGHSHYYMKVPTQVALYHEGHGAILKHKCGKRIVTLPLLSFSLIFLGLFLFGLSLLFGPTFFIWPFFFFNFLTWDNALIMMIITLLFTYNSKNYNLMLRTKYDSM